MKTIVLNHKSYLDYNEITKYKKEIEKLKTNDKNLVLMPNLAFLSLFKESKILLGTQNFYSYNEDSYTGEINLETLKSLNITYTLIGHPERILYDLDTYSEIKDKLFKSLNGGFNSILCLGHDSKLSTIKKELKYYLKGLEEKTFKNLILAYEPANKIETDDIDIKDLENKINFLKSYMLKLYNIDIKVLYGGGINKDNLNQVLQITDGVIIGKKSIDIKFVKNILTS